MKRARFTEDQIIGVLEGSIEAGAKTADLARKHGVPEATLTTGSAKYGGMDVSEAKRLKQLEDENAKSERSFWPSRCWMPPRFASETSVKKMVGPAVKREEGVAHLRATMGLSERRACSICSADPARWSVTAHAGCQTRSFGRNGAAISPTRGGVSDIVGCSSCCGRRANPSGIKSHSTGFIAKKASTVRKRRGSEARRGVAGADPGRDPSRTLAGRWISSMTSLPAAGGSAS